MKVVICSSVDFTLKIKEIADKLIEDGHKIELPYYVKKVLNGEVILDDYLKIKQKNGDFHFRKIAEEDLIKRYFNLIKNSDAILVVNEEKNNIKNYIGGSVLAEMAFAYVLDKKIFLLNPVPQMSYSDEIKSMKPIVVNGDLNKIK